MFLCCWRSVPDPGLPEGQSMNELKRFFYPDSVAVVGASEALTAYGTRYIQALLDIGFDGKKIYAVNRSGDEVLGYKIYRSVHDIPDYVDLACICVGARFVPDTLRDCLKKGVKAAIVLSAGFREYNEDGRRLEEEVVEIAQQGIRVMGPNCFGTYCPDGKITVVPGGGFPKQAGGTALIAQSGQLSEGITARSFGEGIRYAAVASYGNACNINEADLLEYFMQDEETKLFTSYLEGVRDGKRFFEIARANAGRKPVVIWKVGMTRAGAAAASSHTGSLAGAGAVWDAFFRQTGAIRIGSLEELIDTMVGFSCLPEGCGRRVALVSGGGAGAVISADACETTGMQMPDFSAETIAKLHEVLPPVGTSLKNPLDIGNPHPPLQILRSVLDIVAADDAVDVVVIRRVFFSIKTGRIFSGTTAASDDEQGELLQIPVDTMNKFGKPVVIMLPDELTGPEHIDLEEDRRKIRDFFFSHKIPVYLSEQRTFTALSRLASFSALRAKGATAVEAGPTEVSSRGRAVLSDIVKTSTTTVLDELRCKKVMKEYGITVTEPVLTQSEAAAVAAAQEIGFPVVMKIVSPQITHKSDMGGVRVGLKSGDEVSRAYREIMVAAAQKVPEAVIDGIAVQKMAPPGLELVVGMNKDPQFGPVLMFGLGGTLVEVLKDVTFRILPLTRQDAQAMIREIRAYRLLEGYRGQPAVDVENLEELLLKVSAMIQENTEIKEMDINPLIAYGSGAIAVDARIILEDTAI
jgi:acetate---CoA ligase (ADP-forming)